MAALNLIEVQKLHDSKPIIQSLFKYWKSYSRNVASHKAYRLFSEVSEIANYNELVAALRDLQNNGCGQFILGRRGQESRFVWADDISMTEVVYKITGGTVETSPEERTIARVFKLARTNGELNIKIELPANFNEREANRLCDFVRSCSV